MKGKDKTPHGRPVSPVINGLIRSPARVGETLAAKSNTISLSSYKLDLQNTKDQRLINIEPIVERMRNDVYWIKANGKQYCIKEPLTLDKLAQHVNGGPAVGLAPMQPGESTTRIALLDFDSHKDGTPWEKMVEAAERVSEELGRRGMEPNLFRSSGGKGIHLYLIWDKPQDAYSVRSVLQDVLAACGFKNGTGGVKQGEVEVFPKQDQIPPGGFGNMWNLPLAGESVPLFFWTSPLPKETQVDWQVSHPVELRQRPQSPERTVVEGSGDLDELRSALDAIQNRGDLSLDYESWRNVIFGIHHESGGSPEGLELAHDFSAKSEKYQPDFVDKQVWPYINSNRDNPITAATIYNLARQHGWTEDLSGYFSDLTPNSDREIDARFLVTDLANAERLQKAFGSDVMFSSGRWFVWTGTHWRADQDAVRRKATKLSQIIKDEEANWRNKSAGSEEERKNNQKIAEALDKWAKKSEDKSKIDAAFALLKRFVQVDSQELDRDRFALNCKNGTVDLRTGKLRPHDKTDRITKVIPYDFNPNTKAPKFEKALAQITGEMEQARKPVAEFLQIWFGYCATGEVCEQVFVIHYGLGANGKSLLLDAISHTLGDYAGRAAPGLLVGSKSDRHPTEIADLFGKRFVVSSESGEDGFLREEFIKQLTGDDKIKARFVHQDFFEFSPTHKINLVTNYKPQIRGNDHGIWRRVLLIPYRSRFGTDQEVSDGSTDYRKDPQLLEALKDEAEGILAWIVKGARMWNRKGLNPPDTISAAGAEYRSEMDRIGQFVEECCEIVETNFDDKSTWTKLSGMGGIFTAYKEWTRDCGYSPLGRKKFQQTLELRYLVKKEKDSKDGWGYFGIKLIEKDDDSDWWV